MPRRTPSPAFKASFTEYEQKLIKVGIPVKPGKSKPAEKPPKKPKLCQRKPPPPPPDPNPLLDQQRVDPRPLAYADYLLTPHWQRVRQAALRLAHSTCAACGHRHHLQIHHLHYNSLWHEHWWDVKVLCDWCHAKEHGKL